MVFLDEIVLPNEKIHWQATQLEFRMTSCLAAMERMEKVWFAFLGAVALKIKPIYTYTQELNDSIIVAEFK